MSEEGAPPAARQRRRTRYWRRAKRVGLGLALAIFGLTLLGLVGLRVGLTEARSARLGEAIYGRLLRGRLTIGTFHWRHFPDEIGLENIELRAPDGTRPLQLDRVELSLDVGALFWQEVRLRNLRIEGGRIDLRPPSSGEAVYGLVAAVLPKDETPEPSATRRGPGWTVQLDAIKVQGLSLGLQQDPLRVETQALSFEASPLALTLPGVRAELRNLKTGPLRLTLDETTRSFERLEVGTLHYLRDPAADNSMGPGGAAFAPKAEFALKGVRLQGLAGEQLVGEVGLSKLSLDRPWPLEGTLDLTLPLEASLASVFPELGLSGVARLKLALSGALADPQVAGTFEVERPVYQGLAAKDLSGIVRFADGHLSLERVALRLDQGAVQASASATLLPLPGAWNAKLEFDALALAPFARFGLAADRLPGRVSGELNLSGRKLLQPKAALDWNLQLLGAPALLPPWPAPILAQGRAHLAATRLELDRATLAGGGLELELSGHMAWETNEGSLKAKVHGAVAQLGPWIAGQGLDLQGGPIRLDASLSGALRTPHAEGRLELQRLRRGTLPPLGAVLPFHWDGRTLSLDQGEGWVAGGHLEAGGRMTVLDAQGARLSEPELALQVQVERLRLQSLGVSGFSGLVRGQGTLQGSLSRPRGQAQLSVEQAVLAGLPMKTLGLNFDADGDRIRLSEGRLVPARGGELALRGQWNLRDDTLAVFGKGTGLPGALISGFVPSLGAASLEGAAGLELEISGALKDPSVRGTLSVPDLRLQGASLGGLSIKASGTRSELGVDATLEGELGTIHLDGSLLGDGQQLRGAHCYSSGLKLGPALALLESFRGAPLPTTVAGKVSFDLRADGALPLPALGGQIRASGLSLDGAPLVGGDVIARLAPGESGGVALQLAALGALDLQASLLLVDGAAALSAHGTLRRLALSRLLPQLEAVGVEAVVAGQFDASYREGRGTATATLSTLKLGVDAHWLSNRAELLLAYADQQLTLSPVVLEGDNGRFEASGVLGKRLDFSAKGQLELALIPPFVSALSRASGQVGLDLRATGTLDKPRLLGSIKLLNRASLRPRTLLRELNVDEARIDLLGDRAVIRTLRGEVESGRFDLTGEISLSPGALGSFHAKLHAVHFPLRLPDFALTLGTTLDVSGRWPDLTIEGDIDLERGRYFRHFELKRFNFQAQEVAVDEELSTRFPWLEGLQLNLHAKSSGGVEVLMNAGPFSLELGLDSDLRIMGTAADPIIAGEVVASRGEVAFPAATLQVSSARIDFEPDGAEGVRPLLDLVAEGEVEPPLTGSDRSQPSYFVSAGLSGDPFSEMPLRLNSDPSLSQLEILSLLTTGRVISSLGGSGAGLAGGDAAIAFAGSQLVQPLTRFVTRQMEQTLNLDLQLDAALTSAGVTVSAGKEISRRLRLEGSFQRTFEAQSVGVGRARFLLSDRFFLEYTGESVTGQSSSVGALQEGSRSRLELKLRLLGE